MNKQQLQKFQRILLVTKLITFLLGSVVFVVSRYAFIFFLIAMIPTMLAVLFDNHENKSMSATICTFNLMGVLPYLSRMLDSGNINISAKWILADLETWITIYFLSFIGLLFIWLLPGLVAKLYAAKSKLEVENLEKELAALNAEWDLKLEEDKKKEALSYK